MEKGKKTREVWSRFDTKILKDVYILFENGISISVENGDYFQSPLAKVINCLQGCQNKPGHDHAYKRAKKKTQIYRQPKNRNHNKQKNQLDTPIRPQDAESERITPTSSEQQAQTTGETELESAGIWTDNQSRLFSCLKSRTAAVVQPSIDAQTNPQIFSEYFKGVSEEVSKQTSLTTAATVRSRQLGKLDGDPMTIEERLRFTQEGFEKLEEFEGEPDFLLGKRHSIPAGRSFDRSLSETGDHVASQQRLAVSTQDQTDKIALLDKQEIEVIVRSIENNKGVSGFDLESMNGNDE